MNTRVPTVNDLRVKLCYICREEEHFDSAPQGPPKEWTHPCKCTLVAHESCLLKWIQTSQGDSSRAANALKCPQCGAQYELESDRPVVYRVIGAGNRLLQKAGRLFTLMSAVGAVVVFGSGVYILLTAYGAWAVKQLMGNEMFDLLLTDDPANWPWTAFFNLPSLTLSLILSRFQSIQQIPTLIPILLVWPPSTPIGAHSRLLDDYWTRPSDARTLALNSLPSLTSWPPSPFVFGLFLVPITRAIYRRFFAKLQHWVLGSTPLTSRRSNGLNLQLGDVGPFFLRIRVQDAQRPAEQVPAPAGGNEPADVAPEDLDPVAAAEQLIEIDSASFGRRVGGALLIPAISSVMGSFLFRLSKRSQLLRNILGVRPPLRGLLPPAFGLTLGAHDWEKLSFIKQLGMAFRLVLNATWNGTRTWAAADPVWWRNSLGLGIFVVAKDCIQLLHLWLAKRELETRRVKTRDFEGIDIKELDLIPSFVRNLA
ncbi:hypothetical protein BDZ94DRAFT_1246437 [Collybia nuda]|uniref:RING-CH-type domain-containing protein n=1 Tax=Collybia nuda TaxID=64659 RepID=A0A9P6CNI0_9AGAR|nr:hypothetical protein BDZ94DRAFT_1246437 [Collybia nuda]